MFHITQLAQVKPELTRNGTSALSAVGYATGDTGMSPGALCLSQTLSDGSHTGPEKLRH